MPESPMRLIKRCAEWRWRSALCPLRNVTPQTIGIAGWTLCDLARHCYTFPAAAAVAHGDSAIVYTGPGTDDGRRFYMGFRQAIWSDNGDVAVLVDATGRVVARYAY